MSSSGEKDTCSPLRAAGQDEDNILRLIKDILDNKQRSLQQSCYEDQLDGEREALFLFCQTFQAERKFSKLTYHGLITKLFHLLMRERVCEEWLLRGSEVCAGNDEGRGTNDHVRCVLMTVRLLLRDEGYQLMIKKEVKALKALGKSLSVNAERYLNGSQYRSECLQELTNIFQKISSDSSHGDCLIKHCCDILKWLVHLLTGRDLTLIQCSLCALTNICKSLKGVDMVASLSPLPHLMHIVQFYDITSRQMTSDLLLLLTSHSQQAREQLIDIDGLQLSLRLLHSDDIHILYRMVSVIEKLCEDRELQDDFRLLGGVPLLLALLSRSSDVPSNQSKLILLKTATCSAITQLTHSDINSCHFIQENCVYLLAKLIIPANDYSEDKSLHDGLHMNAWRALRYLYSCERNRKVYQRLLPPKLYEMFIDIGHYVRHSSAYTVLVQTVNNMTPTELIILKTSIEECSIIRSPLFTVGGYSAYELLGSGAFGNVYKVRKSNSDIFLAMKEIKSTVASDKTSSIGKIMNEVNIIKEQLQHPNVVNYHKCFEEDNHLYIIMELIEGVPLSDIITSLIEKKERFEEERIWRIFTQLTLALRYLHKDKHVIHRDLKPSNLMVGGETDKLTITDFGLAKQKQRELSVMESTVGTLSYWCPELVHNEPYTEKADIWAAGCLLYQMATLRVPFQTTNILALAKKIAEVNYPAIPDGHYSQLVSTIVSRCLTANVQERPDSVELGSLLVTHVMMEADRIAISRQSLQYRLDRERQKTIRYQQKHRHHASLTTPTWETTPTHRGSTRRRLSENFITHLPLITSPPGTTSTSPHTPFTPPNTTRGTSSHNIEPLPPLETAGMDWGHKYSPALFHKRSGIEIGSMESAVEWNGDSDIDNVFPETLPQDGSCHSDMMTSSGVKRGSPLSLRPARGRSYSAVLPGQSLQRHHHSGCGHGAICSQTASTGSGRGLPVVGVAGSPLRCRTASTSSTLSLSSRHLREITDPITHLLTTLQRLLTLSIPMSHTHSSRLVVLDRYQRSLFQTTMSPVQIKGELHRLGTCSGEGVWLLEEGAWSVGPRLLKKAVMELSEHTGTLPLTTSRIEPCTLTYDLLATIIDSLHNELKK